MRVPTSYRGLIRRDKGQERTYSQSKKSNTVIGPGTVEQLLDKKGAYVFSVKPEQTMREVVDILREKRIGAVIVTDDAGALIGILSERDIVRKLAETPGQTLPKKVEELMTTNVATCDPDEQLTSVLQRMTDGRFRHMPVQRDGKLLGMVTIGDVVHYRLNELEHEAVQLKQMIVG
ncbi:MAG: CBS domain-containing protein [Pseudomonadota bacterium]